MKWTVAVLLMVTSVVCAGDLKGVVTDEKNGPVAGAVVSVVAIAPRKGEGFGAGYYADWQKHGVSDGEG
ncbi:MAG TPA: hypothetical protein VF669_06905 [Tepidisphaeraceae bacterium]